MRYDMTRGGEKMKRNKKFRRTKPLAHWAFLCNLQGKFLRSESHLWGFSTSPLLRRAEAIAHQHTLTPHREVSCQIRDCFPCLQALRKVRSAQSSVCVTAEGKDFSQKELAALAF